MEEQPPSPPQKSSAGKVVAFVGCGCLGLILLIAAGVAILFFGVTGAIKKSTPYEETLALVQSNPAAVEALGEPIKAGTWFSGNISINNGVGEASMSIPLSGPKGSGTMYVDANKPAGSQKWNYSRRELQIDGDDSASIQLGP
ncbi:MAG: cytochrome c oxidase assembly factor 1 family protein [Verrucomicrobiota bacterium]